MCDTDEFNLFLANVEEFVFDEDKIVSIGWLSRTLGIHISLAKKLLLTFANDKSFKSKLSNSWFLMGTAKSNPSSRKMLIVSNDQLESARDKFDKISSEHIYSIQKCGNNPIDMNTIYMADQSAENSIAKCPSLSNIKCDQVEIVKNRRSVIAAESASNKTKPTIGVEPTNKPEDKTMKPANKKSPIKCTVGNMFSKKNEEIEKIKEKDAKKKEAGKKDSENKKESTSKEADETSKKNNVSPAKKSSPSKKKSAAASKKKGADKGAGSANISSFFSKGPLPEIKKPEASSKKSSTVIDTKVETKDNKKAKKDTTEQATKKGSTKGDTKGESKRFKELKSEEKDEDMDVDEPDENKEPEERVENVNKGKKRKEEDKKDTKSKSSKKPNKSSSSKKNEKDSQKRRRIQVFSDSSDSEQEEPIERDRSPSPPPPSPPRLNILSDDEEDVIPPTPEAQITGGGRKRKRKLITKTMTDDSGFLRTVKEFETISCSDSDGEAAGVKQNAKKSKVAGEVAKVKTPPVTANHKSPAKTKQTSILNFFKKS